MTSLIPTHIREVAVDVESSLPACTRMMAPVCRVSPWRGPAARWR